MLLSSFMKIFYLFCPLGQKNYQVISTPLTRPPGLPSPAAHTASRASSHQHLGRRSKKIPLKAWQPISTPNSTSVQFTPTPIPRPLSSPTSLGLLGSPAIPVTTEYVTIRKRSRTRSSSETDTDPVAAAIIAESLEPLQHQSGIGDPTPEASSSPHDSIHSPLIQHERPHLSKMTAMSSSISGGFPSPT